MSANDIKDVIRQVHPDATITDDAEVYLQEYLSVLILKLSTNDEL